MSNCMKSCSLRSKKSTSRLPEKVMVIKGTKKLHQIILQDPNYMLHREVSSYCKRYEEHEQHKLKQHAIDNKLCVEVAKSADDNNTHTNHQNTSQASFEINIDEPPCTLALDQILMPHGC